MRVDGTSGLDPPASQGQPAAPARRPSAKGGAGETGEGWAVERPAADKALVQKAKASPEVDLKAVAEAKRLLASGRLDTPEAIRRAAEAILSQET